MKLFYAPNTRAEGVRWLLDEMMVDYDIVFVDFSKGEHKSDLYKEYHPLGQLPALEDEGNVIFERVAIMLHLVDRFRAKSMAPPPGGPERARFYQWMIYTVATMEPALMALFSGSEADKPAAKARYDEIITVLEKALAGNDTGPWLLGQQFSAADCLIGSHLALAFDQGLLEGHARLVKYVEHCAERPAYKQVPTDFPTAEQ